MLCGKRETERARGDEGHDSVSHRIGWDREWGKYRYGSAPGIWDLGYGYLNIYIFFLARGIQYIRSSSWITGCWGLYGVEA